MTSADSLKTPVDRILEEQQILTAVERFSKWHEPEAHPAQQKYYRDLIPLTKPQAGQQYAFEVDLDRCSGCQACVTACHSLNGLDDNESWRAIGMLSSDDGGAPYQATVTTACHHCVDPGCLTGCPVLAYDKDPATGIVRHLDDQCIGCQYCVMKCPYEVPQFSAERGIVRKCDMCSSRLEHGEAPACVQACPSQAIRITLVDQSEAVSAYRRGGTGMFLPTAPDPGHTVPTTKYVSSRPLPSKLVAGDHARVSPAHSHPPLVLMLVLSQLAVGAALGALGPLSTRWFALVAATAGALAVVLGAFHLGRPLKAWRAFLGWRTSWFSREVIVFAGFIPTAALSAVSFWFAPLADLRGPLAAATAGMGLLGVVCSAMIYVDTHREFWNAARSFGRFFGTTVVLGLALSLVLAEAGGPVASARASLMAALLAAATLAKLAFEQRIFRHLLDGDELALTQLNRTAYLLSGRLGLQARLRVAFGAAGGVFLAALIALSLPATTLAGLRVALAAFLLCVTGELLERYLFFTSVAPDRMPGGRAL